MYIYAYIQIPWNMSHHKKEGDPVICDNMNRPWGYWGKQNKLERGRQILYHAESKKAKLMEAEVRMVFIRV